MDTSWLPLSEGDAVYDEERGLPAVVRELNGSLVSLHRPQGLEWEQAGSRVRPATHRERLILWELGASFNDPVKATK